MQQRREIARAALLRKLLQRDDLSLLGNRAPTRVLRQPAKEVLRAAFARYDVDEVEPELFLAEALGLAKSREVHRVAAQPILGIGPEGHATRAAVSADQAQRIL